MEYEKLPPETPTSQRPGDENRSIYTWGMICHLSALVGFIWLPMRTFFIPFGHLLVPLVIWLIKRNDHPFIDEQGKESLNFQISMTIYGVLASILVFVLVGFFLLFALAVLDVILVIIASVRVSNGESYKYPFTIRFIK